MMARRARAADVAALVWLRSEMFAAMGVTDEGRRWQDEARAWFERRIPDPSYGIFVVEEDQTVVACAMGAIRDAAPSPGVPGGRDVLISNVCTAPAHRGCGYGRAAFEAVTRWASATGVERAELMATESGRTMYERAGFRVTAAPAMRAAL